MAYHPIPAALLSRGFLRLTASALMACAVYVAPVAAESLFQAPGGIKAQLRVGAATPAEAPWPGSEVVVTAQGLKPGQKVVLQLGTSVLSGAEPVVADEKGAARIAFTLPQDAVPGLHQAVLLSDEPSGAALIDIKVSPKIALLGAERFTRRDQPLVGGLYQAAYNAAEGVLFVTATAFGDEAKSALLKVDPASLEILAQVAPEKFPEAERPAPTGGRYDFGQQPVGVFGIGLDTANGTIWTTNTAHNTIAIYRQSDLSLVKQFPPSAVYHSRGVIVDEARGKAYVTSSATNSVYVFDTKSYEQLAKIEIESAKRDKEFSVMGLALDAGKGRVFVASRLSDEVAVIDTATDTVASLFDVPNARNVTGLAFDAAQNRVLVASQDSDNLVALDAETGAPVFDVPVGGGALAVAFEPVSGNAFVSTRTGGTIAVVSSAGELVANLDGGNYPNHVAIGADGAVFAVNKSLGTDDAEGDRLTALSPAN